MAVSSSNSLHLYQGKQYSVIPRLTSKEIASLQEIIKREKETPVIVYNTDLLQLQEVSFNTTTNIGNGTTTGGLNPRGDWNALTNSPFLSSSVGTESDYYIVSISGSTNLNGVSSWVTGDWVLFTGGVWRKLSGGMQANAIDARDVLTITVNNQTVFNLSMTPENVNLTQLMINGQKQTYGIDYTIAGTVLTWLNTSFRLATTDRMEIYY